MAKPDVCLADGLMQGTGADATGGGRCIAGVLGAALAIKAPLPPAQAHAPEERRWHRGAGDEDSARTLGSTGQILYGYREWIPSIANILSMLFGLYPSIL